MIQKCLSHLSHGIARGGHSPYDPLPADTRGVWPYFRGPPVILSKSAPIYGSSISCTQTCSLAMRRDPRFWALRRRRSRAKRRSRIERGRDGRKRAKKVTSCRSNTQSPVVAKPMLRTLAGICPLLHIFFASLPGSVLVAKTTHGVCS